MPAIPLLLPPLLRRPLLEVPALLLQISLPGKKPAQERPESVVVGMDAVVEVQARPVVAFAVIRTRTVVSLVPMAVALAMAVAVSVSMARVRMGVRTVTVIA